MVYAALLKQYKTPTSCLGVLGLLLRRAVERYDYRVVTLVGLESNLLLGLEVFRLQLGNLTSNRRRTGNGHVSEKSIASNHFIVRRPIALAHTHQQAYDASTRLFVDVQSRWRTDVRDLFSRYTVDRSTWYLYA